MFTIWLEIRACSNTKRLRELLQGLIPSTMPSVILCLVGGRGIGFNGKRQRQLFNAEL